MNVETLINNSKPFLEYVLSWEANLPELLLKDVIHDPSSTAIVSVDVINGFCYEGALASPRVQAIISPIVDIFKQGQAMGVENIILAQDNHEADDIEFNSYPPHCVRGTAESESVPEFQELDFYSDMVVIEKNSISATIDTKFGAWLDSHPEVTTFIVVGDCTDLCTYQLAMGIHLRGNARNIEQRVVLPANCVATYDMSVADAQEFGAVPHDGDLLHHIFLYSMMLNGVEVVKALS